LLEGLIDGYGQLPSEGAVAVGVDAGRRGPKPDVRRAAGEQLEQVVLEPAEPRVAAGFAAASPGRMDRPPLRSADQRRVGQRGERRPPPPLIARGAPVVAPAGW